MQGNSVDEYRLQISAVSRSTQSRPEIKAPILSALYVLHMLPLQLEKATLPEKELHSLFSVTDIVHFYASIADYGNEALFRRQLESDFAELEQRGVATASEVRATFEALIGGREFNAALALQGRHLDIALADIPRIEHPSAFDETAPAALSLSGDGKSLVLSNIDMSGDTFIVVVAGCHFARDATAAIKADPELAAAFKKGHAVWIENAHDPLSLQDLKEWNDAFPDQPLSIAYDNATWRQVDFSSQPAFFFFKDGKLVSERHGWSAKKSKPAWRESLRELGLLDETR